MNKRDQILLNHADKINCDTLVAFKPENIFYMTGFWGEAVAILHKGHPTVIVAPELEVSRAKSESKDCDVLVAERSMQGLSTSVVKILKERTCKNICTDCDDYQSVTYMKRKFPKIKQNKDTFYSARMIKDESEIRTLKKASKIIDNLFDICTHKLHVGQRESDMQSILMAEASMLGAFDTGYASTLNPLIIAGGPNGALPHAQVSQRKFKKGDLVVVDLTLRYDGYVSDATRTFAMGNTNNKARIIYDIVHESQKGGLDSVRSNASCKSVDDACRSFIDSRGYGKYFVHSTGHGVGLEVHEMPIISQKSQTNLQKNMAITVEPGIYVPGKLGVRIEDTLVVRDRKPLILHKFTKELIHV